MDATVIGGGIGGLTTALSLHRAGIGCRVFEASSAWKPLGVGINLQAHAVKELSDLGLEEALIRRGIVARERAYFTAHGQLVYREPLGRFAGLSHPHISIQRSELHNILLTAVIERLGADAVHLGHRCCGIEQDDNSIEAKFAANGLATEQCTARSDIVIACDGLHSAIRHQFFPDEPPPRYSGKISWRAFARAKPFLSGATVAFVGAYSTGMFAAYPVRNYPDDTQLLNLIACIPEESTGDLPCDGQGRVEDFINHYRSWTFDWIDVPKLFSSVESVLELPLLDRDPLPRWTFGRATLLGDAAHPMSPRGGNGAAQAIIDAATLARCIAETTDPTSALLSYEEQRRPATRDIILANRENPPDTIIEKVEQRTGGKRFVQVADVIAPEELRSVSDNYQRLTGVSRR